MLKNAHIRSIGAALMRALGAMASVQHAPQKGENLGVKL